MVKDMSCKVSDTLDFARVKFQSYRYIIVDDFYSIGDEPRSQIDDIRQDLYCELIKTPAAPKTQREDRSSKDTRRRLFTSSSHENDDRQGSPLGNHFRSTDSSPASVMTKFSFENDASQSPSRNKSLDPSMTVAQTPVKTAKRMRSPYNDDLDSTVRASKILRANDRASYLHSPLEGPSIQRSKPSVQALAPRVSAEQIEKHLVEVRNEMTPDKDTGYGVREDGFTTKQTVETTVFRDPETPTKLLSGYTRVLSPLNANSPSSKFTSTISTTSKMLLSIKRPLNIRSLAAVTGVNASKNKVYDFFAVVAAVDASVVKPELMPLKRDIRIVDPSTEKRVLVSIFVDPVNFKPSVGTVALFRSLTTNRYDGGMLNAYPQHCGGKQWFIRDPVNAEGCDVLGLRKWWEEQSKP